MLKYISLFLFLPLVAGGQHLKIHITSCDVHAPSGYKDYLLKMHLDENNRLQGRLMVYKTTGTDSVFLFNGTMHNNALCGPAVWYTAQGELQRKAVFSCEVSQKQMIDDYMVVPWNLAVYGQPEGEYEEWTEGPSGSRYKHLVRHYTEGKLNGIQYEYYASGQQKETCAYKNGLKEGECTQYYENGQAKSQGVYGINSKKGEWTYFRENGLLAYKEWYGKYGQPDSAWFFNDAGQPEYKRVYEKSFYTYAQYNYTEGKQLLYYTHYSNNLQDKTEVWYHPDGSKKSEVAVVRGYKNGTYTSWYPNGQMHRQFQYNNGKRDGKYTSWYENGRIKAKGEYVQNEKKGKWQHYRPDGSPLSQVTPEMELEESSDIQPVQPELFATEELEVTEAIFMMEAPTPGKGMEYFAPEKDLEFMRKYKTVSLVISIDQQGEASFKIDGKIKTSHADQLLEHLKTQWGKWSAFSLSGTTIACTLQAVITFEEN